MRFFALALLVAGAYAAGETCGDANGDVAGDDDYVCPDGYDANTDAVAVDISANNSGAVEAANTALCCTPKNFSNVTPVYAGTIDAAIPNSNFAGRIGYTYGTPLVFDCDDGFTAVATFTGTFVPDADATGAGILTGVDTAATAEADICVADPAGSATDDGSAAADGGRTCWKAGLDGLDELATAQAADTDWAKRTVSNEGEYKGGEANGGCEGDAKVDGNCVRVGKSGDCPDDGDYICVRKEYSYKRDGGYESSYYGGCVLKADQEMGCGDSKKQDNAKGTNGKELLEVTMTECFCDEDDCNSLSSAASLMTVVGLVFALLQ